MKKSQLLFKQAQEKYDESIAAFEGGDDEQGQALQQEAESLENRAKSVEVIEKKKAENEKAVLPVDLPTDGNPNGDGGPHVPAPDQDGPGEDPDEERRKSVNVLRYANVDLTQMPTNDLAGFKAITDTYGGDYRQIDLEQSQAFDALLRNRGAPLDLAHEKALKTMYFPLKYVAEMIQNGNSIKRVKATMVEGVSILGGYAVPPERSNNILSRAQGLTAVRSAGAMVVQTSSKMIEWIKITGGGSQYPSGLRGAYGSEIQSPTEKNFNIGLIQIPVHVYTYKVPMSVSLMEDADNMVQIFERLAVETIAVDEDRDFLTGDGANKPRGVLPGQANADSLTEVNTGDANNLKMDGLKKLRRGVDSQYRLLGGTAFIGNNQSGEDIELLKDGDGRYFFETLVHGQPFMGGRWFESESLPDPSAGVFPLIFGNFGGYAIVERLGLTIQRYNDSNTGPNVVEYHIRRRIGGRVVEPYRFAVQKVSA